MTKNHSITPRSSLKTNPDASLLAMVARHADLIREMDRIYSVGGDDATYGPEHKACDAEAMDLENRIVATRAYTRKGLRAKLRFIHETRFVGTEPGLDTGDFHELVVRLDEEAIGASKRKSTASKQAAVPVDAERVAAAR